MGAISKFVKVKKLGILVGSFAASVVLAAALMTVEASAKSNAERYYVNSETGYVAAIFDGADYLTDSEEGELIEKMESVTEYTNVLYVTDENNVNCTESYSENLAESYAHSLFGTDTTAVVYVCDNEYDYIYSQGSARKTITSSKAYSITDNVYSYSADEEYYRAAVEAFRECENLFQGKAIAEPMKYICNAFVALFLGFIICYAIISKKSSLKYANYDDIIKGAICYVERSATSVNFVSTSRTYSPQSSSSGGHSGGHHSSGGHHGGGGHSGGGHSH